MAAFQQCRPFFGLPPEPRNPRPERRKGWRALEVAKKLTGDESAQDLSAVIRGGSLSNGVLLKSTDEIRTKFAKEGGAVVLIHIPYDDSHPGIERARARVILHSLIGLREEAG